jgi:hypothetical protein
VIKIFDTDGKKLGANEVGEVYMRINGFPDFTYNGAALNETDLSRVVMSPTSTRTAIYCCAIARTT